MNSSNRYRKFQLNLPQQGRPIRVHLTDVSELFTHTGTFLVSYGVVKALFLYKNRHWTVLSKSTVDLSFAADIAFEIRTLISIHQHMNRAYLDARIPLADGNTFSLTHKYGIQLPMVDEEGEQS